MKLFYETSEQVTAEQLVNESNGTKTYKIKGVFSTIGERNKNGRVYPSDIWTSQVEAYQSIIADGHTNSLMELEHPTRADVDMMEAVAKIEKLEVSKDGKYVMGEAILLNNPKAEQLKSLIDAGIKMQVSSRGVGKVSSAGIVENFKLSTYDVIANTGQQSDYNAHMMGIVEGVLQEKEFEISECGCVGEVCDMDTHKDARKKDKKKKVLKEDKEAYQKFFDGKLAKWKVKSPAELSDEDKKKFFDEIKDEWKGTNESAVGSRGRTTLKDAEAFLIDNPQLEGAFKKVVKKMGGKAVASKVLSQMKMGKTKITEMVDYEEKFNTLTEDVEAYSNYVKKLYEDSDCGKLKAQLADCRGKGKDKDKDTKDSEVSKKQDGKKSGSDKEDSKGTSQEDDSKKEVTESIAAKTMELFKTLTK